MDRQIVGNGFDDNSYLISAIFEIYLDTEQPMRPYTLINNSAEGEVLFSPGTKFVLRACRKLHDDGRLWYFKLNAISQEQQEQLKLTYEKTFSLYDEDSMKWATPDDTLEQG